MLYGDSDDTKPEDCVYVLNCKSTLAQLLKLVAKTHNTNEQPTIYEVVSFLCFGIPKEQKVMYFIFNKGTGLGCRVLREISEQNSNFLFLLIFYTSIVLLLIYKQSLCRISKFYLSLFKFLINS